jgi:hypothetical protein
MKMTPEERRVYDNFLPGKISKNGFLGNDARHIHDIIKMDLHTLSSLGLDKEVVAERLQWFIEEGKKGLEGEVDLGEFSVEIRWDRGMGPCPFGEPGLYPKITAKIVNKDQKKEMRVSQLGVHMIREHGFFGGKGSVFRLEPAEVVRIIGLKTE